MVAEPRPSEVQDDPREVDLSQNGDSQRDAIELHENGQVPWSSYRIFIAIPTQDQVQALFTRSIAVMMGATAMSCPGINMHFQMVIGTLIAGQRQRLAEEALAWDATHILWLDTDMTFPPDTLVRLLAHGEPVVGCNYPTRKEEDGIRPVARAPDGQGTLGLVHTTEQSTGLQQVLFAGMGVMLTEARVFQEFKESDPDKPWFFVTYHKAPAEDNAHEMGEDVFFCRRALSLGFPVFIDHDLSKEIEHIGQRRWSYKHTLKPIAKTKPRIELVSR